MKKHISELIFESINRGKVLKKLIPHPLKYAEFSSLSERCTAKIDSIIRELESLQEEINTTHDECELRYIYRQYRICYRELDWIEHSGVTVLKFENESMVYLNKLLFKICREINLPLGIPNIASFSNKYYYYVPLTNVIFVPLAESEFLLHLPDIYHELGHYVSHKKDELSLKEINSAYINCINIVTQYYTKQLEQRMLTNCPQTIKINTMIIHRLWKENWFEEFFCDVFATCLMGSAYAWAHMHLISKYGHNVCEFNITQNTSHPSDESRLRIMLICLEKLGFSDEAKKIKSKWKENLLVKNSHPEPQYHEAYPDELLNLISEKLIEGIKRTSLTLVKKGDDSDTISNLINNAWGDFWKENETFRVIELEYIKKIKGLVLN
ncbi:MAG: hypothetical protein K9N07_11505 [Candidatus Cloacimonetes bacterium]|nr:hypothetical protein [Candidatus Cloacimonadota bacterium]